MTTIKKSFASDNIATSAIVILDFNRKRKRVEVRLEGTILSEHVDALRDFLKNVIDFPGNRWGLELEDLEVISLRGLRVLVKFAKVLRRRGDEVEIKSIQPSVFSTLRELKWCEHFAWKKERQNDLKAK